jgi:hypothetical protein
MTNVTCNQTPHDLSLQKDEAVIRVVRLEWSYEIEGWNALLSTGASAQITRTDMRKCPNLPNGDWVSYGKGKDGLGGHWTRPVTDFEKAEYILNHK